MTEIAGPDRTSGQWVARLASLIHEIRPDWDEPGIRAQLAKCDGRPLAQTAAAAIAAAADQTCKTPGAIVVPGRRWEMLGTPSVAQTAPGIVTYCEHGEPGSRCLACNPTKKAGVGMPAELRTQIAADIAAAKEELARKEHR